MGNADGFSVVGSEIGSVLSVSSPRENGGGRNEVTPVFADEVSNQSVGGGDGMQGGNHCGILQNTCLPCLPASTVPSVDKKKSFGSGTASFKKKAALRLSFKWREENATPTLSEFS